MSNVNIRRAVDNIRAGSTSIYTPVIELIVNGIQAIAAAGGATLGEIRVTVLRGGDEDLIEHTRGVEGFSVTDTGIGFDAANREAFDTFFTDNKASEGGKGFGRFTCLKYFTDVRIESVFREGDDFRLRTFAMGFEKDIIVGETLAPVATGPTGSTVTLTGIRSGKFPDKGLDIIARILVEKLLPYLVDDKTPCPRIVVRDADTEAQVVLSDYLKTADRQIEELSVVAPEFTAVGTAGVETFRVRVFKFFSPRSQKSKIALVAHRREVTDTTIQAFIPEFAEDFYDPAPDAGRGRNFIIKAYVYGDYLDRNVSLERGTFEFGRDADLFLGISQAQIEERAAEVARETVGGEIATRRERKTQRVRAYVTEEAPWHTTLVNDADLSGLSMNPSAQEIELHLQKEKFHRDVKVRRDVAQVLADPDTANLGDRVARLVDSLSQSSKNDLIHYVSTRKCVLELFRKSLELNDAGKHQAEGDVHDIIIPRRRDSDDLEYDQHNLWILDERLNFTSYLSSDKPVNGAGSDRADLAVYNRKIAYRGDNEASNPIIIFEFKRPGRDDFVGPSAEDPVQQIVRYVNGFRDQKFNTPAGRKINVSESTTFYGYIVCDLTPKVERWLEREKNFTRMPDGLGWFMWFGNINLYIEVISWDKLLKDAEMRNKIFFHKLGM
ncbi:MAG: sensor histidine kinase [Brevundimonas sp.]|uniref:ATP-binding protein n=1 Tax=Brevundimonas sp. TaxID=1871086 RepID=UPI0018016088|nr:ATP-binding protein [Brevundimonas sp.]MBA4804751.1 sensor histidine kinase [Brevundimonas sp.]